VIRATALRNRAGRLGVLILLAGGALVMAWLIVKEAIEPHWVIRLGDVLRPGPPPVALTLGDGLALHVYADTRPHIGKITPIQKGPVLVQDGVELIEEGYGFGLPIVIHGGRSYLPQHADVSPAVDGLSVVKRFRIDVEDTWTEPFRPKYRPVEALGMVVFTYTVAGPGLLDVAVDLTGLTVQPELVYLANEQGATHFRRYSDSDGIDRLLDDRPDTPDQWIPTTAARTCFTSEQRGLRFCVETAPGQAKYVGRERYFQRRWSGLFKLAWAGTDIELRQPSGLYRYRIVVETMKD
jgi:hypothetical protein